LREGCVGLRFDKGAFFPQVCAFSFLCMPKLIDLTGQVFGQLTVLSFVGVNADGKSLWNCKCTCGNIVIKRGFILRKGKEHYCGNQHPTKICTECKKDKPKSEYHKLSKIPIGINATCKECKRLWYIENREDIKNSYAESMKDPNKKKRKKENNDRSRIKNKEQQRKQKLIYNKRPEVKKRRNEWHQIRKENDLNYVIKRRLRWRVRDALKKVINRKSYKYKSSIILLGCDMDFFKNYIESKFTEGMNWNNISQWHIDHIKPCGTFDLTQLSEQQKCFHYTNMQPLWWFDNLKKSKS